MVRDYSPVQNYNNLLDRVLRHRDAIISHLNWACIFLGMHAFGMYIHNDTMQALGRPQDMFSDKAIQLQPIFAQWVQAVNFAAPGTTAPNALATSSYAFGGDIVAVNGKIAMMPIKLGTADFMVHHIHAFTIHVTVLILLKGVLFARSSRLIPDKANLGLDSLVMVQVVEVLVKFQDGIITSLVFSGCTTVFRLCYSTLAGKCNLMFGVLFQVQVKFRTLLVVTLEQVH